MTLAQELSSILFNVSVTISFLFLSKDKCRHRLKTGVLIMQSWCTDEDGVARKEETGKAKKEVYGCGERGHG